MQCMTARHLAGSQRVYLDQSEDAGSDFCRGIERSLQLAHVHAKARPVQLHHGLRGIERWPQQLKAADHAFPALHAHFRSFAVKRFNDS